MHRIEKPILERYFSKSRIEKYKEISLSYKVGFVELYKINIRCSEEFFTALIQFEVVLRNAVSEKLREDFGDGWFDDENVEFLPREKESIKEVKKRLIEKGKEVNSCNIVSNLTFGFWVKLFNSGYDKTLWRKSLYKVFLNGRPSRSRVRERLKIFHGLRNRISHCEHIIQLPLQKYSAYLIETLSWINPSLGVWLGEQVEFKSVLCLN